MAEADRNWIDRRRLITAVDSAPPSSCVVVEAHAGFGKSVLAEQLATSWAADGLAAARIVATQSTDLGELASLIAAEVGVDPASAHADAPADAFAAVLRSLGPGGRVVLDDAHHLTVDQRAVLWEAGAADAARLVVCSRRVEDPALPRAVLNGRMVLLDEDDLAFDSAELDMLAVTRPTDGWDELGLSAWPALTLRLAAGDDALVAAYLRAEVLPELPPGSARLIAALNGAEDTSDDAVDAIAGALDLATSVVPAVGGLWPVRTYGFAALRHRCWTQAAGPHVDEKDAVRAALALAELECSRSNLARAGQHATRAAEPSMLERIASDALMSSCPSVPVDVLDSWLATDLLDEPMRSFVELSAAVMRGAIGSWVVDGFDECARRWSADGADREEVAALVATGLAARKIGDHASMARVLARMDAFSATEVPQLGVMKELGRSIHFQLTGEPMKALEAAQQAATLAPVGVWSSECEMMIAGSEVFLGRFDRAIAAYERATTTGSDAARALAYRACAFARVDAGDDDRAMDDAEAAVGLARRTGNPALAELMVATRACLASYLGRAAAGDDSGIAQRSFEARDPLVDETALLWTCARICGLIARQDLDGARAAASVDGLPGRPVHAVGFLCVLQLSLGVDTSIPWEAIGSVHPIYAQAIDAAAAARAHLAGGPLPDPRFHSFLPRPWTSVRPAIRIRLLGCAEVRHDGVLSDHQNWARTRVRELCTHLAAVPAATRRLRATDLWPDLTEDRASANMRVTLTQLLDVLEPGRRTKDGTVAALIDSSKPTMAFREDRDLVVDVWEARASARRLTDALSDHDLTAVIVETERLVGLLVDGSTFGGSRTGEWADPLQRDFDHAMLTVLEPAGVMALEAGEYELAERCARCALRIDPWSETSGRHVVQARLGVGNVDAARRSLGDLLSRVAQLGVPPSAETTDLVARLGHPMLDRGDRCH